MSDCVYWACLKVMPVNLRAELERRSNLHQEARAAVDGWSEDPRTELWNAIGLVAADNTAWLAEIVTQQGWPRLSDVGEEAAIGAWVLAQHADMQMETQRMFHQAMAEALETGEALAALLRLPEGPGPGQQRTCCLN